MSVEALVGKALLTSDPSERQWIEDQITVNLWARRLLAGNHSVIVIDAGEDGTAGYTTADFPDLDSVIAKCDARGWKVILGSVLYTIRDNPRKYPGNAR